MADMNTSNWSKSVSRAYVTEYIGLGYKDKPDMTPMIATVKSTDGTPVQEVTLASGLGTMYITAEGGANIYDNGTQLRTQQYVPTSYRLGFSVTKDLIRDGKGINLVAEMSKELGCAYRETRVIAAHDIYNGAFGGSIKSADNATLIGNAHSTSAGTLSNVLTVAAVLSEASLEQARIEMVAGVGFNDRGIRKNVMTRTLYVPVALEAEANRILYSEKRVGTADNDLNALKYMGAFPGGLVVSPYFTSATAYFIGTDVTANGVTMWDHQGYEYDTDVDFDTDTSKHKIHARFMAACPEWRALFGSAGV